MTFKRQQPIGEVNREFQRMRVGSLKIVTIVGARPQFIKASVVSTALATFSGITEVVVHTGQHYDTSMSEVFFSDLDMAEPRYNLGVGSGTHGQQTGRMIEAIERVLFAERPDCLLVYGDTNSTLAGAIAASKLCIPVAHVEAGLRSFNRSMPEEINRIMTDRISHTLFAPTDTARDCLLNEGTPGESVYQVGDVMYDVALRIGTKAAAHSTILEALGVSAGNFVLCTVHRAENTDHPERLRHILDALNELSDRLPAVFPVHPRTRRILDETAFAGSVSRKVKLIGPVGYLDMAMLEQTAALIATDSGGIQKEAFFYRVPCVTFRDETEWIELIRMGWNRLAPPTDVLTLSRILQASIGSVGEEGCPYGDGHAADRIAQVLLERLSQDKGNLHSVGRERTTELMSQ